MCYLAYYRGISVAVNKFKPCQARSQDEIKKEEFREAEMIRQLSDHRGLPLLFGIITKSPPLRLITQFHGEKNCSTTLHKAIKKLKFDKSSWQGILINISEAQGHLHKASVLQNDLKSNNVVMENMGNNGNLLLLILGKRH